jgi:hypothetical protein
MSPTTFLRIGSPGRTRTNDKVVNSHLLYQLSYRGSVKDWRITPDETGFYPLHKNRLCRVPFWLTSRSPTRPDTCGIGLLLEYKLLRTIGSNGRKPMRIGSVILGEYRGE